MPASDPLTPYAWDDTRPPPLEKALPLSVQPYIDALYLPPIAYPAANSNNQAHLKMYMVPAWAQLLSQLPDLTNVWVYRQSPEPPQAPQAPVGPTIEVSKGQRIHVDWLNCLTQGDGSFASHPVVAVRDLPTYVRQAGSGEVHASENLPGFSCARYQPAVAQLPAWTVVHLHGERTVSDYDRWLETGYYPGKVQSTTALVLLYFIAAWEIITGILEIVAAIQLRRIIDNEWVMVITGIASIIFGIVLFVFPGAGALSLVWLIGIYSVAFGILLIVLAFRLRGLLHERGISGAGNSNVSRV